MAEGVGQADQQGLDDLQLLDGFLALGQQDAPCALGTRQEIDAEVAKRKAREMKAEGSGLLWSRRLVIVPGLVHGRVVRYKCHAGSCGFLANAPQDYWRQ